MSVLKANPFIKAGANPSIEEMKTLYRKFRNRSAKPPLTGSIEHNIFKNRYLGDIAKRAE